MDLQNMIKYIKHHISDLSTTERQDILQMIVNSSIEDSKIQTKGDGTQIKFKDIPKHVISMVYNYIQTKLTSKLNELQYFPNNNEEDDESVDVNAGADTKTSSKTGTKE